MYPVSNQFLEAVRSDSIETNLTGTIGSATFTKNNIVAGSFHISNQCTDTSDIKLGSVFLGQLTCTFVDVEIAYTNWIGKDITPTLSVKVGENAWESVPLGVFRVMEAKHTAEGVMVTAYDNMRKFDRKIKKAHFKNVEANLHTFVTIICSDCHITFGMTQEEFFELPNSSETTFVFGYTNATKKYSNDIETYRDLLFYVAQTMGCFATIDRNGQLVFRNYKSNVAETISDRQRLSGAQFADYITNYTGIYVTNMKDDTEDYYGYDYELINAEIELVNQEILQIESDLVELQRQYDEHEITEEEYLAQKKALETERKQCNKRLNWLYKARDKAQAGEEGTFMDLGANPFLQDDSSTVRERMRRRVLKALDPISYTPFTCDSVMGAHYDLGDVIYFTGGHAGSDGVFCCLMAFDWTYNAEYQMQGFGVDPSILNIKDRNTKKTKEANTNALNAKEMSSGMDTPINSDGKQDDIYIKYAEKTTYSPLYPIKYEGLVTCVYNPPSQPYHFIKPDDIAKVDKDKVDWDTNAGVYDFDVKGYVYRNIWSSEQPAAGANGHIYNPYFKILVPEERGRYKITFDASWSCPDGGYAVSIGFTDWTSSTDCGVAVASVACSLTGGATMTHYEYVQDYLPGHDEYYVWISMWFPYMPSSGPGKAYMDMKIRNLRVERVVDPGSGTTDGGVETNVDRYIDKVYVKDEDPQTLQEYWKEIEYVAGIDESSHSGLELDYKRYLHLTPEVMRAWLKADPPQAAQTSNRFCVRYTGKPDTALSIAFWGNSGWLNKSIKRDSEGAYTLKSGGTVSSGVVEYCGYTITGLVAGERYYFNFKANFKDGTQFGDDYDKGLGIVLTTAGYLSTDDFSGDPHTFDPDTGYCSFYRSTAARFYDFSFVAPASSIHMFVTVGDIVDGQTSSLTLSRFVISRNEKDYIRQFYIYDTESNDWLQYKPWGSDEEGESASLSDLDDVNIGTVTNGQVLKYDSSIGAWVNADEGTGTEVEANPAGTATGELKKIAIDDDIYKIVDDNAVHTDDVGTAAAKDFTTSISSQNTNLPTSGAVKDAIDAAISSAYKPSGSKTVAELVSSLLVADNMGNVYNMSDSGETTSDFVEGAGKTINTGDNVGIVNIGTDANPVYKFDLLSGFIDMSDYYDKDEVDDLLDAKADNTPTFSEASTRTNLAGSGETMTTILGKIKKFFSDLKTVAFSGSYNDLSNKPTIPTVNNGTLTIQKNGTQVATFSANQSGNATANIECATPSDVEGSKVVTGNPLTITDAAGIKAEKIEIALEPKQDKHGYNSVWVGGAGKNKLPTVLSDIKTANSSYTWNGNVGSRGGIDFTVNTDNDGNVININVNTPSSATSSQYFLIKRYTPAAGTYILNGCPSGGGSSTYRIYDDDGSNLADSGSGSSAVTLDGSTRISIYIYVKSGTTISNKKFYPMLRLSSETDPTFAPYSNISPITGYTSLSADGCGKNLINPAKITESANHVNGYVYSDGDGLLVDAGQYTLSVSQQCNGLYVSEAVEGASSISYVNNSDVLTFTIPNKMYIKMQSWRNSGVTGMTYQLEKGNQATTYEAYKPKNVTVQFNQTLYGGKLTILQDGSADIYCDTGFGEFDGSDDENWTLVDNNSIKTDYIFPAMKTATSTWIYAFSSDFSAGADGVAPSTWLTTYATNNPTALEFRNIVSNWGISAYTVNAWKSYLASRSTPLQVAYELQNPFTIHLSPVETLTLLQGLNNVWTDGTTLSLTYQPDNAIGQAKGTAQEAMAMVNALASTAVKVFAKKGQYEMSINDWVDMPDCSLSLDKGTYVIIGWLSCDSADMLYYNGHYYRYGCAICDSSNNRLVCNTFLPSDVTQIVYGGTISTFYYEKITSDATVRKLKGYMPHTVSGSKIAYGGIVAIKIA